MSTPEIVSTVCSYPSRYCAVKGSMMHYIEIGEGDPVLFVHGMPTWSYLWRNVLPCLADKAHCIAVDLIGMGRSDKPDIKYTVFEHIEYLEAFIKALDLQKLTLVLHGWGSVIGFEVARRLAGRVRALAFYEAQVRATTDWEMLSLPIQQLASLLNRPGAAYRAVVEQNYLIKKLIPAGMLKSLTEEEKAYYAEPFPTPDTRRPLWQYIQEVPLGQGETPVVEMIQNYSRWLQETGIPKLMLYGVPGFITTMDTVRWASEHLPNLTVIELENALHFAQESIPDIFCQELRNWYLSSVAE